MATVAAANAGAAAMMLLAHGTRQRVTTGPTTVEEASAAPQLALDRLECQRPPTMVERERAPGSHRGPLLDEFAP
jgi:hypothetical protein